MEKVKSFKRQKEEHEIYFKEIDLPKVSNYFIDFFIKKTTKKTYA